MEEKKKESLLEKSLSLSSNGGIYYGGARVPADERRAVLFIGLGGSGADALIRIKDQIKNRMILPTDKSGAPIADTPKNIGFLEIDTDATVQKIAYGNARFDPFGNEVCCIGVSSIPDLINSVRQAQEQKVECWDWFDRKVNAIAGGRGANGIRQIGRLLLVNGIEKIKHDIEGKIDYLTRNNPDISGLSIFVFSGISGGTGAGTFLDMAYIVRKLAKQKLPSVSTMGYLIMTDVNELNGGKVENLRTNGFACLKELDYWMSSAEHGERYQQKFPNGFELNEFATPFDFCHLLDASDIEGHNFSYDKILRSVAENVFAYVAGEVQGSETSTGSMVQMYDNIQTYIQTLAGSANYPGCYNFLSIGASKIEIPYTEISTLIAARVFERLNAGMFQNRPDEQQFNTMVYRDLEMSEEPIRSALYRNVKVARPQFVVNGKTQFKYGDIWPNNAPYQVAHNWLAQFQRDVVQQAGNLPSYLEGKLKSFIKSNLQNKATGPIYLRYFVKSQESYCLYHMLEAFKTYCRELQAQCASRSKELNDNMQAAFAYGANIGKLKHDTAAKQYLNAVDAWYQNEEHAFLNEKIADVIEQLMGRLTLYYENILKPLTDILLELPSIFQKNVDYIRVQQSKVEEGTDILIRPLEFEQTKQNEFNKAVLTAESNFLGSLSNNIRKWIGRDIDEVDDNIVGSVDVSGFISNFVSQNFSQLLTINMEAVMNTKLTSGQSLTDYIKESVDSLYNQSFPMYKQTTGLSQSVSQFAILSVPSDCPQIYKDAKAHIASKNLSKLVGVKKSEEKSRMYLIKVASGYPLFSNAFIQDMESTYEEQMGNDNTSIGKHTKYEWINRLPSPYIEPTWVAPYVCRRTKLRNEKYRAYFDRCVKNGIIVDSGSGWLLKRANPELAASVSKANLTAPTILEKMEQFEKIKAKLWSNENVIPLSTCGRYMRDGSPEGDLKNVQENVLRFPTFLDVLEQECKLADRIEEIEEELHYPKYFALANMNHMISINKITGDTTYRRTETDPFPITLTKGQEMHPDYKDFQIFKSFSKALTKDIKEEIDLQYENLKKRIEISEDALNSYVETIKKDIETYKLQEEKARNAMYEAGKEERPAFLEKIEFYQASIEELKRMLPSGDGFVQEQKPQKPAEETQTSQTQTQQLEQQTQTAQTQQAQPQEPPRYLNPQTWQPIANPQIGQQVFDTKTSQMVIFQPEAPRYLNPQTWQPIANPQPGQQVFDTKLGQMIVFQPEPPRYLNPQTWQPIANPQPGQQVFDTKLGQMTNYNPYAEAAAPAGAPSGFPGAPTGAPAGMPNGFGGAPAGAPNGYPGAPAGAPTGMPNGFGGAPSGYPGAPTGAPAGMPNGFGGAPTGVPNGYPGAPTGAPAGMPNGFGGAPTGMPNGFPGAPTGAPNGFPGAPMGTPNGYPGAPTENPTDNSNEMPSGFPGFPPFGGNDQQ